MDSLPTDIRTLRAADAAVWRAFRLQALKEEPASFAASYEEAVATDAEALARSSPGDDGPNVLFGPFGDGVLAGAAGFVVQGGLKRRHKGLLWGVYVRPAWRGRGFSKALVGRVIEHARGHVALLQASATVGADAARRVYLALGFELYGLERAALRVDGVDIDEELLWIDFRDAALPAPGISDRRAP